VLPEQEQKNERFGLRNGAPEFLVDEQACGVNGAVQLGHVVERIGGAVALV